MLKLVRFLRDYKKECILGPFFKLLEAVIELLIPTAMAWIIDNGVLKGDRAYVWKMGLLMLVMATAGVAFALICQYFAARASQGFGTQLRDTLFAHITTFSHKELDKFGTPSLITRVTSDVNQLQVAVAMLIRLVVRAPFICIGALVMAMFLDWQLSLILLVSIPVFALILWMVIRLSTPIYKKYQSKLDRVGLVIRENLSGVRVIRAFAKAGDEEKRFAQANDDLTATAIRVTRISALLTPLTTAVMNIAILLILWFGGLRIDIGGLSSGEIVAFVNYMTQILLALVVVSNLIVLFTKAAASASRVNEVLETETSVVDGDGEHSIDMTETAVAFCHVSFSYNDGGDYALEDVTARIGKGQLVGVIGATGSGKSTFVGLIPRFYDASVGSVLVGGVDVKAYPLQTLRGRIGIVEQSTNLFSGTIADNLRMGKPDALEEEMRHALRVAQALDFVDKLEDGLSHPVAAGGTNFSGGQRQRLAIARAVVRRPEILILDDASSALDFATEARLRRALRDYARDMTTIIVSQRASSIMDADTILVFRDGALVGQGTHRELLDSCDEYAQICRSQLSEEELKR